MLIKVMVFTLGNVTSAFSLPILRVVLMASRKQMIWVATSWHITLMANYSAFW